MFSEYPDLPPQVIEELHQRHLGFVFRPPSVPSAFTVRDYVYDDTE